jgi:hypothetical protein|tara:strand:- start:68 stop:439 length:372 start_codon:yes stop_codon:yes gene_type:complete
MSHAILTRPRRRSGVPEYLETWIHGKTTWTGDRDLALRVSEETGRSVALTKIIPRVEVEIVTSIPTLKCKGNVAKLDEIRMRCAAKITRQQILGNMRAVNRMARIVNRCQWQATYSLHNPVRG